MLGATRTVIGANDSYRDKQWDKVTGVFVGSSEVFRNWSVYVTAVDTNMWRPQILRLNQTEFYVFAGGSVVLAASIVSLVFVVERKRRGFE